MAVAKPNGGTVSSQFVYVRLQGERLTWSRTLGGLLIMAGALVIAME
jgi:drug/metabolite transporter (DMT)-like permease